jgi:hypothetical protein
VPENSEMSLLKALAHQPVSVGITAGSRDFQFYKGVNKMIKCYLPWAMQDGTKEQLTGCVCVCVCVCVCDLTAGGV